MSTVFSNLHVDGFLVALQICADNFLFLITLPVYPGNMFAVSLLSPVGGGNSNFGDVELFVLSGFNFSFLVCS